MANYTTQTSNKSKKKAIKLLLSGGIGLHLFYVGRIGSAIARAIIGLGIWILFFTAIFSPDTFAGANAPIPLLTILLLIIFNIPDFFKLILGKFRDNVGDYLRT